MDFPPPKPKPDNVPEGAWGWRIGYARVSTDDQDLTLQIDALMRAGVKRQNIFTDKASGATTERPGFVSMWKVDLRDGDTLVVWKLDRLGRNLSQLISTLERLESRGCNLVVLTEQIDTTTPMGRFVFHMMGAFAQLEREMIAERTKAGLLAARERGRVGGRPSSVSDELLEQARLMIADEAEGGEGLSVLQAAKRLKVARSTLYNRLRQVERQDAGDLEPT